MSASFAVTEEKLRLSFLERLEWILFSNILGIIIVWLLFLPILIFQIISFYLKKDDNSSNHRNRDTLYDHFEKMPVEVLSKSSSFMGTADFAEISESGYDWGDEIFNIVRFRSLPKIIHLEGKYFKTLESYYFKNNIIVQELLLSEGRSNIGYINCETLDYTIIQKYEFHPSLDFSEEENTLKIVVITPGIKRLLKIKSV